MILEQYFLACLAHASYLIGDTKTRTAVIVDPQRDIDLYLAEAEKHGLTIRHVFLTHFHADFVAGHLELRERCGATIHLGARGKAEYEFVPMKDGDTHDIGDVRLRTLETPGHTPEGISILVFDLATNPEKPKAVLTGDTLFIGDVGRPDLMASEGVTARELAGMLYHSLHEKLLTLPDETLVYPAHGAGSMCGKNMSTDTVSTIGQQRKFNYALQPMSEEDFVAIVTADQPEAPRYFSYDATLNKQERATLESSLKALSALPLEEVLRIQKEGAQILDVRDAADFAGAHLASSIHIGLDGKFATWAGTLLRRDAPIVIVAEPGRGNEAATRLGRIGLDHVAGVLEGGMEALEHRPDLLRRTERVTASNLAAMRESPEPPLILDVRTGNEWTAGHIDGSLNIPLSHLEARLDEVAKNRRVVVHCATGYRSSSASSLLEKNGFTTVADMIGGIAAWKAARLETTGAP